jgi:hypothetical protein
MDKVQKLVILSVILRRQNTLDSTFELCFRPVIDAVKSAALKG